MTFMVVKFIFFNFNITKRISSYSPAQFIFFLKSRLLLNVFHCFCMFLNKYFANFTGK